MRPPAPSRRASTRAPRQRSPAPAASARAVAEYLPALHSTLELYLPNPITLGILFRPIKTNVVDAVGQLAAHVDGGADGSDREAGDVAAEAVNRVTALLDGFG